MAFDTEEVLDQFEKQWVLRQNNEWYHCVWFQSIKREIQTGYRPEEGIRRLAQFSAEEGSYTIRKGVRKGQLRPHWEKWLDDFRHYEDRLKDKLRQFIEQRTGQKLHPAQRWEEGVTG